MKELAFLFDHFAFFLVVWILVGLDFVVSIIDAWISDDLAPRYLPQVLRKVIYYTAYLMFANLAEYVSALSGQNIGMAGIVASSAIIIGAEIGEFKIKFEKVLKSQ